MDKKINISSLSGHIKKKLHWEQGFDGEGGVKRYTKKMDEKCGNKRT